MDGRQSPTYNWYRANRYGDREQRPGRTVGAINYRASLCYRYVESFNDSALYGDRRRISSASSLNAGTAASHSPQEDGSVLVEHDPPSDFLRRHRSTLPSHGQVKPVPSVCIRCPASRRKPLECHPILAAVRIESPRVPSSVCSLEEHWGWHEYDPTGSPA